MKKKIGLVSALSAVMLLSACGSHDNSSASKPEKKETSATNTEEKNKESQASFNTDKTDSSNSSTTSTDGVLNSYIKESTKGQTDVVYNNSEPNIDIDFDGFKFKVSQYQVVHVKNAEDEPYSFKGEKEGYVITLKASIDNQSGGKAYFNNPALQGKDEYDTVEPDVSLINENDRVKPKKDGTASDPAYYEKGESKTGFIQYELSSADYKALVNEKAKLVVANAAKDSMLREHLGEKQIKDFPLSGESANKQKADSKFYADQIGAKNIAEKTMIEMKESINEKQTQNDIDLTLDGVQYTKLDPSDSFKNSFTGFGNEDIVAVTVKMNVENGQSDSLPLNQFSAFLDTDKMHHLNQSSLESDSGDIESGQSGTKYLVFLMKKSEFEDNKKFELRIRHIEGNSGDALKDHEVSFSIKR
ncbi:DUF5068 domain-containing protein [Bacillus atrophaeus]|uniref:DUF5068 domain-containing protein n=1 Tax=Bacillus atrophaeus TaxID=1452 RepID=UPI0022808F22|nr:DUF5068 domain-containing protein [Bacillus atrophaeus]MCY8840336.1 DUF5068 domain-containing protein [Bacillus atrophaeus]MEC0803485.1 DUF5068 domain-containing protein [Bacillus atrophaeus]MEC0854320.1 DUF5068 domain-containing protein [Bacillus atrophaeus]MEC0857522.1 DUF5068 domain-containing protein [Bacillus atrophaeus]MEC0860791.1 DUF5068 domain-containing protein [Bacillus atrophaeus]